MRTCESIGRRGASGLALVVLTAWLGTACPALGQASLGNDVSYPFFSHVKEDDGDFEFVTLHNPYTDANASYYQITLSTKGTFVRDANGGVTGEYRPRFGTLMDMTSLTDTDGNTSLVVTYDHSTKKYTFLDKRSGESTEQVDEGNDTCEVTAKTSYGKTTYVASVDTETGKATSVQVPGLEWYYLHYDPNDASVRRLCSVLYCGGQYRVNRLVYTKRAEEDGVLRRVRVTTVEFNSDDTPRCWSSLYVYYDDNPQDANNAGQLRYVIDAEGVRTFLKDKGLGHVQLTGIPRTLYDSGWDPNDDGPLDPCSVVFDLDNLTKATDGDLASYASSTYNHYDAKGRVIDENRAAGCGGCGGGEEGQTTYAYGDDQGTGQIYPVNDPPDFGDINAWRHWKRTTHPTGLREVEFSNQLGQLVFRVVQQMNGGTIVNRWVTHYQYRTEAPGLGQQTEHRYPSACTVSAGYVLNEVNGWTIGVKDADTTVGLVELRTYDVNAYLETEKVRQGTKSGEGSNPAHFVRKYTYAFTEYGGAKVYRVATLTEYPKQTENGNDSCKLTTIYGYEYYQDANSANTHTVKQVTLTYPAVTADHNGSAATTSVIYRYYLDPCSWFHYVKWTKHEDGAYSFQLRTSQGHPWLEIADVDTSKTSDSSDFPAGWPARSGVHLKTVRAFDNYARLLTETDPGERKTKYCYTCTHKGTDPNTTRLVVITAPHVASNGHYDYAPVSVEVTDLNGRPLFSVTGVPTNCTDGNLCQDWNKTWSEGAQPGSIAGAFNGTLKSRADFVYSSGRLEKVRRYHSLPTSVDGGLGTNYHLTVYRYDSHGQRTHEIEVASGTAVGSSVEQVTKTEHDQLGRVTEVWRGVSDTSHSMLDNYDANVASIVKKVGASFYDEATPGSGTSDVGDGRVTSRVSYCDDANYGNNVKLIHRYDYRGRLRGVQPPAAPYTVYDVDNMGRTTAMGLFASTANFGDGWSSVLADPNYAKRDNDQQPDGNRRTLTTTLYDEKGQAYRTEVYSVDPSNGHKDKKLVAESYYDQRGRLVARSSPARGAVEYAYDGAGRQYQVRLAKALSTPKYTSGSFNYRAPVPSTSYGGMSGGDQGVLQLTHNVLDANSNVTESVRLAANHDDTDGLHITNHDFVQTTSFFWYDVLHLRTDEAYYGTNDTTNNDWIYVAKPTRPDSPPARDGNALLTSYTYSASTSRLDKITDPNGTDTSFTYDALGRTIKTLEDSAQGGKNRATLTEYDGLSNVTKLIADTNNNASMTGGAWSTDANDQVTTYTYANSYDASLVTKVKYPDSLNDNDAVSLTYSLDGQVATRTGQKHLTGTATKISHEYDTIRRLTQQRVTDLGGANGYVKSIKYTYDSDTGRLAKVGSYDSNDCTGDPVNELAYQYNGLGMPTKEYQDHAGPAGDGDPYVQYDLDDANGSGVYNKGMRLKAVRYPNGRKVHCTYGSSGGIGDALSRVAAVNKDDNGSAGTPLASYGRTGDGGIVVEDYQDPNVRLDLWGQTGGTYAGFDRFGRVKQQLWRSYTGNGTDLDKFGYGHDHNSNRIWRRNLVASAADKHLDELYKYDRLNRLTDANRGDLNEAGPSITNRTFHQAWTLSITGNWEWFKTDSDGDGDWDANQSRYHNNANEITAINESSTHIGYGAKGNMIKAPKPGSETTAHYTCSYDAWNRLVEVKDGSTVVAQYRYDGLHRRIAKMKRIADNNWDRTDYYYTASWQVIEERLATGRTDETKGNVATSAKYQYVWSQRYIDAAVCRDEDKNGDGDCTDNPGSGSQRLFYLGDGNFNVTALVDGTSGSGTFGQVVERYIYDPYGKPTVLDPNWSVDENGQSDFGNEILYCGYRYNPETGLYQVRYRELHPTMAWMQRDPEGYFEGMRAYEYVRSEPGRFSDYSGLYIEIEPPPRDRPGFEHEVTWALRELCPCAEVYAIEEVIRFKQNMGAGVGVTQFERRALVVYADSEDSEDDFCRCFDEHVAGCVLLHDLLSNPNRTIIRYTPDLRGTMRRGDDPDPGRIDTSIYPVSWNPDYPGWDPGKGPDRQHEGHVTSMRREDARANAIGILGHELTHAWDLRNRPNRKDISALPAPPGWNRGQFAWFMEVNAVRAQNQIFQEITARTGERHLYNYDPSFEIPEPTKPKFQTKKGEESECPRYYRSLRWGGRPEDEWGPSSPFVP